MQINALVRALKALGDLLSEADESFHLVVVGGASLLLRSDTDRLATQDVDVIAYLVDGHLVDPHPLPTALRRAVERVAENYGLDTDWLNATVARSWSHQWPTGLPSALLQDAEMWASGGLTLSVAGRAALIPLKLHAVVDQARVSGFDSEGNVAAIDLSPPDAQRHLLDLIALDPSDAEWARAAQWVQEQDPSDAASQILTHIARDVQRTGR